MGRDFVRDLRLAVRTLERRPGFSVTSVAVLALGIGAPTTIFSLVDAIFFRAPEHVEGSRKGYGRVA